VYTGLVGGDALGFDATGSFDTRDIGTGKTVKLLSSYSGADAGNYQIASQLSTQADITGQVEQTASLPPLLPPPLVFASPTPPLPLFDPTLPVGGGIGGTGTTIGSGTSGGTGTTTGGLTGTGGNAVGNTGGTGASTGGSSTGGGSTGGTAGSGATIGGTTSGTGTTSGSSTGGSAGGAGTSTGGSTTETGSSGATGATTGGAAGTGGDAGSAGSATAIGEGGNGVVAVSVVRSADSRQSGIVTISVPKSMTSSGEGFSVPLPQELAEATGNVLVTLVNGTQLPSWLRYVPESKSFEVSAVPPGILPLQVLVRIGSLRWIGVITERSGE